MHFGCRGSRVAILYVGNRIVLAADHFETPRPACLWHCDSERANARARAAAVDTGFITVLRAVKARRRRIKE